MWGLANLCKPTAETVATGDTIIEAEKRKLRCDIQAFDADQASELHIVVLTVQMPPHIPAQVLGVCDSHFVPASGLAVLGCFWSRELPAVIVCCLL